MTSAKTSFESLYYGTIATQWQQEGEAFLLEVEIPANTTATVWLPASSTSEVKEGLYFLSDAPGILDVRPFEGSLEVDVRSGQYIFQR